MAEPIPNASNRLSESIGKFVELAEHNANALCHYPVGGGKCLFKKYMAEFFQFFITVVAKAGAEINGITAVGQPHKVGGKKFFQLAFVDIYFQPSPEGVRGI